MHPAGGVDGVRQPAPDVPLAEQAERDRLRATHPEVRDAKDSMNRIFGRIVGKDEQWEANPRLAGIRGSLPESLNVTD